MLKDKLQDRKDLQKFLFIRGFLVSNERVNDLSNFPFYGNWIEEHRAGYWFYRHVDAHIHFAEKNGRTSFICGHCYDPFLMEISEERILETLCDAEDEETLHKRLSQITGVYVTGIIERSRIKFYVDPSGMQSASYCISSDRILISSHAQLIGDLLHLEMDPFVKELTQYKWYGRVMGPYLPADLTPFLNVKRVVPNIEYCFDQQISHKRFWPLKEFSFATEQSDYDHVIRDAADILRKNMQLIALKFSNPWISLTGGIDSNTTFAAANGLYNRFDTFSYLSAPKEVPDVEAAKVISDRFKVKHHLFSIPENNADIPDYDIKVQIQEHNSGYIAKRKDNESRKRLYLQENCNCDVEVKSWVSETIRAYWYKHYDRNTMPKLSPKLFRNLYKIFTTNRKLAHKIDALFAEYIKEFEYDAIPDCYPPADMHYNEVTWGSWGGLNISEMKFCFDITFAYNNREFLDILFRVPLEKRISDQHHLDMKKYLNPELSDMNIRVVNMKETKFRAKSLNVIFVLNRFLP